MTDDLEATVRDGGIPVLCADAAGLVLLQATAADRVPRPRLTA